MAALDSYYDPRFLPYTSADRLASREVGSPGMGLQEVKSLWYQDGDIIMRCGKYLFKVWKDVLQEECEIMGSALPDPDSYDGLPIFVVQDSVKELEYFLLALLRPHFLKAPPSQERYDRVFSVFRLAHKYKCQSLRQLTMRHLTTSFPTTLSAYDEVNQQSTLSPPWDSEKLFAVEVIVETKAWWMFPYAMYQVILSIDQWDQRAGLYLNGHGGPRNVRLSPSLHLLAQAVKTTMIEHRKTLVSESMDASQPPTDCTSPVRCKAILKNSAINYTKTWGSLDHICASVFLPSHVHDPLSQSSKNDWVRLCLPKIPCPSCRRELKGKYLTARASFWDGLPRFLKMDFDWPKLEQLKSKEVHERTN